MRCPSETSGRQKDLDSNVLDRLPTVLVRHMLHEDCVTEMLRKGASGHSPLCREELGGLEPLHVLLGSAQPPSSLLWGSMQI